MSTKIPWNDPDGTPCCCTRECIHTANFVDPLLWDPLTDGGFSAANQIELTQAQYDMFTAGGHVVFEASATASASGSKAIPPGNLVLFGSFTWSMTRKVEATFLNDSCKQKGLIFEETLLTKSCSSSGYSTGDSSEFYPYMELDYPCIPYIKFMIVRFSFYNANGITGGKLYPIGMYIQFRATFRILRTLEYGIEGFSPIFDLLLGPEWGISNTTGATTDFVNLITPEGTIPIPSTPLAGGSAQITYTTAPP